MFFLVSTRSSSLEDASITILSEYRVWVDGVVPSVLILNRPDVSGRRISWTKGRNCGLFLDSPDGKIFLCLVI